MDLPAALPGPLRIACVTETYPPEVNGVAMTVARLLEGLRTRGHHIELIRLRQPGDVAAAPVSKGSGQPAARTAHAGFSEVLLRGVPIPRYAGLRMGLPCKRTLIQLWTKQRPDVVHIATEGLLGRSALHAALALGLPVCSDFRTNFHAYSQHYGFGWLQRPIIGYLRRFHNATRCTMVPTRALKDDLERAGFHDVAVVARGVDTRRFDPAHRSAALRAQWHAAPDDLVVGHVGRLAPEKNLSTLISAFEALRKTHPRAKLVFVGDGPMRAELQARCPSAIFAGQRIGHELAEHYASVDLFLFPSLTETFGNVTTEAMASGLAVVAFDYAAAARVIRHGDNGLLVPMGDNAAFVAAAGQQVTDLARCRALGAAARISARALDWDGVVTQFEGVLDRVMRPAAPSGDYTFAPRQSSV